MGAYRQSNYEPNHWEPQGPPVRPYNWVQWTGVACIVAGLGFVVTYFAQKAHLVAPVFDDVLPGAMLCLIGSTLITTRRAEIPEEKRAEYREKQRRRTYIALGVAAVAALIGFAAAIYSHGA